MSERKVLGRGLSALIPGTDSSASARLRDYLVAPVGDVRPNPGQPRRRFPEAGLLELAQSIREQGLVQPLVVRRDGTGFVIIAGERRWRAAQKAGLLEVPVVVKDVSSAEAFELALVENIQREDLDPIEEAEAYRRIQTERGVPADDLAKRVGKDRSTIANALRLLGLPAKIQEMVASGALTAGHGRALLGLEDPRAMLVLAQRIAAEKLSVRAVERLVRQARKPAAAAPRPKPDEAAAKRVADDLTRKLGTRVRVAHQGKGGTIQIDYHSLDELDRLIELFGSIRR